MIHESDLDEAIAECQGERNPNANTCAKLASYYIIKDYMYNQKPEYGYSASGAKTIEYSGVSEFAEAVRGRDINEVLPIIDELLETVKILLPRVYAGFMRHLD